MGFDRSTFLLQYRIQCYKQVNTKNLKKERKSVSYLPLDLADVTVHPVVVHWRLALSLLSVLQWDGFELLGRPPLAHHVPSLWIFEQPINLPLKLLPLGQVDVVHLIWLYRLLQHLWVVQQMLLQAKKLLLNTTNRTIPATSIRQSRQGRCVWQCPLSLFMPPCQRQC
jgi:hypothetical protein